MPDANEVANKLWGPIAEATMNMSQEDALAVYEEIGSMAETHAMALREEMED